MRILIAEDEPEIGCNLQKGLAEAGYQVEWQSEGNAVLASAERGVDLLILDVMLPGLNGWEILGKLREKGIQTPVLFLTAKDSIEDRVKGLELGGDDYLVKPYAFTELLARVRTLLRRGQSTSQVPSMRLADLEVDLLKRRAIRQGKRIDLTAREFSLLELLMRRRGEVLSKSLIAAQVWDMNFESDTNVIEVAIRRLRAKIDDDFEPKLIQTVRGMGYMMDTPE